jgi:hypothetical protein
MDDLLFGGIESYLVFAKQRDLKKRKSKNEKDPRSVAREDDVFCNGGDGAARG